MLLQTAGSFGRSAKGEHWRSAGLTGLVCAEGEHTQKGVSSVLCDVLSKHMCCVFRALFMYDVSGVNNFILSIPSCFKNMNIYVKQSNTTLKDVNTHRTTFFG
jgi:hypothetical protein